MRVLVCGDRNWSDWVEIEEVMAMLKGLAGEDTVTIVHGGARGADTIAGVLARRWGYTVEVYPADWHQYGRAAGPIRNTAMLESGVDRVIAFHNDIDKSKGTKDTVTKARKMGILVEIVQSR